MPPDHPVDHLVDHPGDLALLPWLLPARVRPHLLCLLRFVDTARRLADAPYGDPSERLARLRALDPERHTVPIDEPSPTKPHSEPLQGPRSGPPALSPVRSPRRACRHSTSATSCKPANVRHPAGRRRHGATFSFRVGSPPPRSAATPSPFLARIEPVPVLPAMPCPRRPGSSRTSIASIPWHGADGRRGVFPFTSSPPR